MGVNEPITYSEKARQTFSNFSSNKFHCKFPGINSKIVLIIAILSPFFWQNNGVGVDFNSLQCWHENFRVVRCTIVQCLYENFLNSHGEQKLHADRELARYITEKKTLINSHFRILLVQKTGAC